MDAQAATLLATIGAWLWSFIAPGAKGLVEGVGKGLGEGFAKLAWGVLEKAHQIDPKQAALVDQSPNTSANQSIAKTLILQAIQKDPSVLPHQVVSEIKIAFKKLLKNPAFFADSDIRHQLVPNLGYTVEDLAGPSASTSDLANMLVDKVVADGKLQYLIREIQELKPQLFSREFPEGLSQKDQGRMEPERQIVSTDETPSSAPSTIPTTESAPIPQPGKLCVFLCSRQGLFVLAAMTAALVIGVYRYLSDYYKIPIPAFLFFLILLPLLVALIHRYLCSQPERQGAECLNNRVDMN